MRRLIDGNGEGLRVIVADAVGGGDSDRVLTTSVISGSAGELSFVEAHSLGKVTVEENRRLWVSLAMAGQCSQRR